MANLEQRTEHIDDMQNLNSINSSEVALDNASLIVDEFPENEKRKIVKTEDYTDSTYWEMRKTIYEDGSRSTEKKGYSEYKAERYYELYHQDVDKYSYTEYYPNGNKKFECNRIPYEYSSYVIYDEDGKVLYYEGSDWVHETDSANSNPDMYWKYDEKGRLTKDKVHGIEYTYDDTNRKVTEVDNMFFNGKNMKYTRVYKMDDDGLADENYVLSDTFTGETGVEIDLTNWWLNKLIQDRHLDDVPYIYIKKSREFSEDWWY